jgi:CheY-like chemotaxis protein
LAYDLAIIDLAMPQMTGLSLAEHLHEIRPELTMVLCTGNAEQISLNQCRGLGFRELIYKPVSRQELAAVVRNALAAPPSNC